MGVPVLIMGASGSGKSASMRNFEPDEVGVFNVASKPLPFRAQLKKMDSATYGMIRFALKAPKLKRYVIDDSQYLMAFDMFDRAKEVGYGKFTDMAVGFYEMIKSIIAAPPDVIVYLLHHTDRTDDGRTKAKTIGKMLDEKLTIEGLFSVVLMAETDGSRYWFKTRSDGTTTVKTPMGMFENVEIDNDLKFVDKTIREYWNIGG